MTTPFILVDGSSYLYRAFHALPPLSTSSGEPTGAIYGVISMLRKLIKEYHPDYMAVVFDAKGKTFRNELYSNYKAHRPSMPEALQQQIKPLYAIIRSLGLTILLQRGVEADDVIGTLAKKAMLQQLPVLISTGDKDFAQLVTDKITLINTMTNRLLDRQGVIEKFGVAPEQITDYFSLIGDSIDNVPGIPNVGPKTAVKWLQQYGNLETLIKNAAHVKGKVGENLRIHSAQLPLFRQLVCIKEDVPLNFDLEKLRLKPSNRAKLRDWYKKLEFTGWLKELEGQTTVCTGDKNTTEPYLRFILTKSELEHTIAKLLAAKKWAFTLATRSDNPSIQLTDLFFALTDDSALIHIPLTHKKEMATSKKSLECEWALEQLRPLFEDLKQTKVGHNLKYDINVLSHYGIQLDGPLFDTLLESYILNNTRQQASASKRLTPLLRRTDEAPLEEIATIKRPVDYTAKEILCLHQKLWPQLIASPSLAQVFTHIEMPLISVLSRMERYGVLIDTDLLKKQSLSLEKRLSSLEKKAYALANKKFNLSSPKQLQAIFREQGLPILEKTPTGQASTSESVLQNLAAQYPLAKILLKHRRLSKLKSTYTDKLPQQVHPKTGRVHTSYHQTAVVTGRLSSTDPNLQNIPIRTQEGRKIRQAFIAPKGYKILSADYSQIELRIMAHFSQDKGLLHAFEQNLDIHQATASEVLHVPLDQVTHEQRRRAKAINFGLIYGMSAFGLARQLKITQEAAKEYISRYFKRYPGVKNYMERTRLHAREQGCVTTLFGRCLKLPHINSRNSMQRQSSERAAINAPLQGTAADIIKRAMIAIDQAFLKQPHLKAHMIMQVHDELVFEVADSAQDEVKQQVEHLMVHTTSLHVPLKVDIQIGLNWNKS